jgi:hypothetical protein
MYRASSGSIMVAGLCLILGAVPGWAGPPNNDASDARGNTAGGTGALVNNTTGAANTAFGDVALQNNTIGGNNTAFGFSALQFNTTGVANTAIGLGALLKNTSGGGNTVSDTKPSV